ncbi:unnamed protein product [Dovyalis caffra]|uniref:Uncharacterized protein n=1 Tax=Dovyalis caffra TaxID=77055 RepID=A0AAV1RB84_9ROSI|nr:unnamed protein product [Dovyalis caffra]
MAHAVVRTTKATACGVVVVAIVVNNEDLLVAIKVYWSRSVGILGRERWGGIVSRWRSTKDVSVASFSGRRRFMKASEGCVNGYDLRRTTTMKPFIDGGFMVRMIALWEHPTVVSLNELFQAHSTNTVTRVLKDGMTLEEAEEQSVKLVRSGETQNKRDQLLALARTEKF